MVEVMAYCIDEIDASPRSKALLSLRAPSSMNFDFGDIKRITDNFSEARKVGSGGYGDVYRGKHNGEDIAVKRLHPLQGLDDLEFHNEFRNLAIIDHPNIIRLIGYCYQSQHNYDEDHGTQVFAKTVERILCFEYMHSGSLQTYIGEEWCSLDWPICYRIIKGTSVGLNHLHNAKGKPILHLDLKPGNILLDKNKEPKIADLGSSRLGASIETQESGTLKGTTLKYTPPECKNAGNNVSIKFDVFSLGVIILDIVDGQNGYSRRSDMGRHFIEFACVKWKGRLQATPSSLSHDLDNQRFKTCVEIALRCTADDPNERPTIKDIVCQLEELEAKSRNKMSLLASEYQSRDFQNTYFPKEENDGPSHKKSEWTPEETEASGKEPEEVAKEEADNDNLFGEVVDNKKLDEQTRYMGKPKTQEDRARVAWSLITHGDKKEKASSRVDNLKAFYGNGQSTLCLFYNATGDTLRYVTNHDWYGNIDSKAEYPAEVGNGQWAAFLHVHRQGEPSGSVGAVVYRGKKKDGQFQEYMLAWSTPWGFYYRNKAYVETRGGINYFQRRWEEIYVKLVNSDYSSKTTSGGCEIEAQIDRGDSPKYIATIKLEHGP